jgi:hypothetical protein
MTGCTLDSDIAPFLAIRPAIKPGPVTSPKRVPSRVSPLPPPSWGRRTDSVTRS